jgi:hypothetical protein
LSFFLFCDDVLTIRDIWKRDLVREIMMKQKKLNQMKRLSYLIYKFSTSVCLTDTTILHFNSLPEPGCCIFCDGAPVRESGPGANGRVKFPVPSLWAKLLEEIRLGHSSAEWRPGIANIKNRVRHRRPTGLPDFDCL